MTVAMAQACFAGTIAHNTPGFVKNAPDLGPVDPSTVISVRWTVGTPALPKTSMPAFLTNPNEPAAHRRYL